MLYFYVMQFVFVFLASNNLFALAERYQLIDLGLLEYKGSEVMSLNNRDQVCGVFKSGYSLYLFVSEPGKKYNYTYVRNSTDLAINNAGDIYGSYWVRVERGMWELDQEMIYKWTNPFSYFTYFSFKDMGYPSSLYSTGYVDYRAAFWDVNDYGQILIMNHGVINRKLKYEVWLYDDYEWNRIDNPFFHAGVKINNSSEVLGYVFENLSLEDPTQKRIRVAVYDIKDGTTHLFPALVDSMGHDINDQSKVVGIFYDEKTDLIQGFFGKLSEEIIHLNDFTPKAVNNQDQIVGHYRRGDQMNRPAIYENGKYTHLEELTDLVDDHGNQWSSLDVLVGINDRGSLIGEGIYNKKTHAFLMVPLNGSSQK